MSAGFIFVVSKWKFRYFKYFTVWGVVITELYFCLLMVAYIVEMFLGKKESRDPHSILRMWKWVSALF
jgi:hypothetical protein